MADHINSPTSEHSASQKSIKSDMDFLWADFSFLDTTSYEAADRFAANDWNEREEGFPTSAAVVASTGGQLLESALLALDAGITEPDETFISDGFSVSRSETHVDEDDWCRVFNLTWPQQHPGFHGHTTALISGNSIDPSYMHSNTNSQISSSLLEDSSPATLIFGSAAQTEETRESIHPCSATPEQHRSFSSRSPSQMSFMSSLESILSSCSWSNDVASADVLSHQVSPEISHQPTRPDLNFSSGALQGTLVLPGDFFDFGQDEAEDTSQREVNQRMQKGINASGLAESPSINRSDPPRRHIETVATWATGLSSVPAISNDDILQNWQLVDDRHLHICNGFSIENMLPGPSSAPLYDSPIPWIQDKDLPMLHPPVQPIRHPPPIHLVDDPMHHLAPWVHVPQVQLYADLQVPHSSHYIQRNYPQYLQHQLSQTQQSAYSFQHQHNGTLQYFGYHPAMRRPRSIGRHAASPPPICPLKRRRRLTTEESEYLLRQFGNNERPTAQEREVFARHLSLDKKTIQVWFQNRRAKLKREERGEDEIELQGNEQEFDIGEIGGVADRETEEEFSPATSGFGFEQCSSSMGWDYL
ncbi:hypothetical protein BGZ54_000828 [Gamsiella multidivaricata]|nr:hypothetical protein BGZ54_000828 [Gamsiella multidivaricata]